MNETMNMSRDQFGIINQYFTSILTNARSLMQKLNSLIDAMEELNADVCIVTETGIRLDDRVDQMIQDLKDSTGTV